MPSEATVEGYTHYFELAAVGQRIGLKTCLRCGAAIIVGEPEVDPTIIHWHWHNWVDRLASAVHVNPLPDVLRLYGASVANDEPLPGAGKVGQK